VFLALSVWMTLELRRSAALFLGLWLSVAILGFVVLARHAQAAGVGASAPAMWPQGVAIQRRAGLPTLVMTLHPECPCSRASAAELERILVRRESKVDVHVLFVRPRGSDGDPRLTSLWERIRSTPGVSAELDEEGAIASRFGAFTSGQVLLYDARGALRFSGGITGSRGHEGDNAGRDAVEALIDDGAGSATSPVFGCSLFAEQH
jgi:hypothetical protein